MLNNFKNWIQTTASSITPIIHQTNHSSSTTNIKNFGLNQNNKFNSSTSAINYLKPKSNHHNNENNNNNNNKINNRNNNFNSEIDLSYLSFEEKAHIEIVLKKAQEDL